MKDKALHVLGFILTTLILFGGCAGLRPSGSLENLSDYAHPDPLIEQIHVQAYNLDLGIGVEQNRVKANELYLKAAIAGDSRSMMNLGINLLGGEGIEKDEVEGFAWVDAARFVTQHSPDMKVKWRVRELYDQLLKELPADVIKQGRERASALLDLVCDSTR